MKYIKKIIAWFSKEGVVVSPAEDLIIKFLLVIIFLQAVNILVSGVIK